MNFTASLKGKQTTTTATTTTATTTTATTTTATTTTTAAAAATVYSSSAPATSNNKAFTTAQNCSSNFRSSQPQQQAPSWSSPSSSSSSSPSPLKAPSQQQFTATKEANNNTPSAALMIKSIENSSIRNQGDCDEQEEEIHEIANCSAQVPRRDSVRAEEETNTAISVATATTTTGITAAPTTETAFRLNTIQEDRQADGSAASTVTLSSSLSSSSSSSSTSSSSSLKLRIQRTDSFPPVSTAVASSSDTTATAGSARSDEAPRAIVEPQIPADENAALVGSDATDLASPQTTSEAIPIATTTAAATTIAAAATATTTTAVTATTTTAVTTATTAVTSSSSPSDSPRRRSSTSSNSKSKVGDTSPNGASAPSRGGGPSGAVGVRDEDTVSKSSDTSGELGRAGSTCPEASAVEKSKSTSRLSERAKKKSWYNVLYPNYKSRSQDFRKLFEEVPNEERLIVDYSCALQRDILVQGRLYVSQNYVCFHANIFRWETYLTVKWKDVTSITKDKTALVIPNAISICTAKEKFFFATFATRDKAFLMLFRIWQNTLMNKQMPPQEVWQWVHNCYGDELGLTTDDEDYIDPTSVPNESECDLEFSSALDDLNVDGSETATANSYQSASNYRAKGELSSGSSGAGSVRRSVSNNKSKSSYFFKSNKANTNSPGTTTSTSGSDNKASDNNSARGAGVGAGASSTTSATKSKAEMKPNAKELTLISAKPDEGAAGGGAVGGVGAGASGAAASSAATPSTSTTSNNPKPNNGGGGAGGSASAGVSAGAGASAGVSAGASGGIGVRDNKLNASTYDSKRKITKSSRQRDDSLSKNSEPLPTDVSDSSDSDESKIPFVATAECNSTHEGRQLVHTILPINIETLFNILFSKSKFLVDFHMKRKSTDTNFGEWVTNEEGKKTRTVNVTVQLAASVGPKTSKVTEYQEMRECSKPGELYSIDITTVNAAIPYADSFCVLMHYCLVRTVDDNTMLSVHAQIKYKKSIWGMVKGFIEKNTWAGLEDFYSSLLHALQSETCIPPAKGKGRRPRRGTAAQIRPPDGPEAPSAQAKAHESLESTPVAHGACTPHIPAVTQVMPGGGAAQSKYKWLSFFVLLLMGFLIGLNIVLLLKLWKLEERIDEDLEQRARMPNLATLKHLPNTHQDWVDLLRQQEILHETELRKWHKVLQTAIELLKKTEKTLAELLFR